MVRLILSRIKARGRISFAEFMELALYHPDYGYYRPPRERIGPRGDYYTSAHVHPVFGGLLARQIHQMWEILGRPSPFIIAEMGAGKGLLCSDLLSKCRNRYPDFYAAIKYVLAEVNSDLPERQISLLSSFKSEGKLEWISPDDLLEGKRPFTGCFLSNELVDAFPVHVVQQIGGRLRELFVNLRDGGLQESPGSPSTQALEEYFCLYGSVLEEGQRAEVNLKALDWMEGVNRALSRGFVLTIDYGYEAAELYHPDRKEGTLLCYFRHTTSTDPYQRIGDQDITSHVNFTALMKKGEEIGLKRAGYTEQYKFLIALGLLQELEELEKSAERPSAPGFLKNKLAMRNLLIPGGMGTLFKVLAQSKGIDGVELLGFQDPFAKT